MTFDFLLRGGTLYDGSGHPSQRGDLAIAGGRIAAIGENLGAAEQVIDVAGRSQ